MQDRTPKGGRHSIKAIISELARSNGNVNGEGVQRAINLLVANSDLSGFCPRKPAARPEMWGPTGLQLEDTWISLTKPEYGDGLGMNEQNYCIYSLGRLSFGKMLCSICWQSTWYMSSHSFAVLLPPNSAWCNLLNSSAVSKGRSMR